MQREINEIQSRSAILPFILNAKVGVWNVKYNVLPPARANSEIIACTKLPVRLFYIKIKGRKSSPKSDNDIIFIEAYKVSSRQSKTIKHNDDFVYTTKKKNL